MGLLSERPLQLNLAFTWCFAKKAFTRLGQGYQAPTFLLSQALGIEFRSTFNIHRLCLVVQGSAFTPCGAREILHYVSDDLLLHSTRRESGGKCS